MRAAWAGSAARIGIGITSGRSLAANSARTADSEKGSAAIP